MSPPLKSVDVNAVRGLLLGYEAQQAEWREIIVIFYDCKREE